MKRTWRPGEPVLAVPPEDAVRILDLPEGTLIPGRLLRVWFRMGLEDEEASEVTIQVDEVTEMVVPMENVYDLPEVPE